MLEGIRVELEGTCVEVGNGAVVDRPGVVLSMSNVDSISDIAGAAVVFGSSGVDEGGTCVWNCVCLQAI